MHRIDGPTADTTTVPGSSLFNGGNPNTGVPATIVSPEWLNDMQENVMQLIEFTSINPAKGVGTDLLGAIAELIAAGDAGGAAGYAAGDAAVTAAFIAADAVVTSAFQAGDVTVTAGYVAGDAAVTTAFQAADAALQTQINAFSAFAAGTKMLFYQATAPAGWTKSTAVNDKVISVVSDGSGGTTVGSWTITGLAVGNTTLTEAQSPSHIHFIGANTDVTGNPLDATEQWSKDANALSGFDYHAQGTATAATVGKSSPTGGDGAHNHPLTADGAWRPASAKCIISTKN